MFEIVTAKHMNHLVIFALVLNILVGTAVFLYVLGAWRRYGQPFLRTLLFYILSFNGLSIVDFAYQYARINVVENDPSLARELPVLSGLLLFFVFCAEFAITLSIHRMVERLKGRVPGRTGSWLLTVWALLFAAASGYGLVLIFRDLEVQVFYLVHAAWIFSMILLIWIFLASGFIHASKSSDDRNALRAFSLIMLAGYIMFAGSHFDFYLIQSSIQRLYDPLMLLLINLGPFIWIRYFYEKRNPAAGIAGSNSKRLAEFCLKHGISNREKEIVQLVMTGKSNKEIEDALCISFSTVKNHLYNVYRKAGVNSRSELIHRIIRKV